jgi:hypothetical protein
MKKFLIILIAISILAVFTIGCPPDDPDNGDTDSSKFAITSPYDAVNWDTFGQYKAALHTHTVNSDGSANMLEAINAHYNMGYDILPITDHVWKGEDGERRYLDLISNPRNPSWTTSNNNFRTELTTELSFITQERWDQIHAGEGREGRPMIIIPNTAEFALEVGGEEMNVFFYEAEKAPPAWSTNLRGGMVAARNANAIFFVNHPGRTTNAQNYPSTLLPAQWDQYGRPGQFSVGSHAASLSNPSNMERWIRYYANLFMEFPATHLVGMEIFNREDRDSRHDRVLWDNILTRLVPERRLVWGYANDDSHSVGGIGINYQMMLMPSNTLENFRSAMINGHSYMVTCLARNEGIIHPRTSTNRPIVNSVIVDHKADTITITAENTTSIVWISEGRTIYTTTGNISTLNLTDEDIIDEVGVFVRANIIGSTGLAAIQPIVTRRK